MQDPEECTDTFVRCWDASQQYAPQRYVDFLPNGLALLDSDVC
jgi:hypothetical protein